MASTEHLEWLKSTYCDAGACVEVAITDEHVYVRNSGNPDTRLIFSHDEWRAFLRGLTDQAVGGS